MVYGLWKPGTEQAEVLAATLGSPSAGLRYHGSDLSTKLKLLGVDVASFGESDAFWHGRSYQLLRDDEKPSVCVRSVLDSALGSYRKLVFKRMPGGGRKLLGGILVNSLAPRPATELTSSLFAADVSRFPGVFTSKWAIFPTF